MIPIIVPRWNHHVSLNQIVMIFSSVNGTIIIVLDHNYPVPHVTIIKYPYCILVTESVKTKTNLEVADGVRRQALPFCLYYAPHCTWLSAFSVSLFLPLSISPALYFSRSLFLPLSISLALSISLPLSILSLPLSLSLALSISPLSISPLSISPPSLFLPLSISSPLYFPPPLYFSRSLYFSPLSISDLLYFSPLSISPPLYFSLYFPPSLFLPLSISPPLYFSLSLFLPSLFLPSHYFSPSLFLPLSISPFPYFSLSLTPSDFQGGSLPVPTVKPMLAGDQWSL